MGRMGLAGRGRGKNQEGESGYRRRVGRLRASHGRKPQKRLGAFLERDGRAREDDRQKMKLRRTDVSIAWPKLGRPSAPTLFAATSVLSHLRAKAIPDSFPDFPTISLTSSIQKSSKQNTNSTSQTAVGLSSRANLRRPLRSGMLI